MAACCRFASDDANAVLRKKSSRLLVAVLALVLHCKTFKTFLLFLLCALPLQSSYDDVIKRGPQMRFTTWHGAIFYRILFLTGVVFGLRAFALSSPQAFKGAIKHIEVLKS